MVRKASEERTPEAASPERPPVPERALRLVEFLVGDRIRKRRQGMGLTQEEMATLLSRVDLRITRATVSNLERGQGLDIGKLHALALALECTVSYLLRYTDDPTSWEPTHWPPTQQATPSFLTGKNRTRATKGLPTKRPMAQRDPSQVALLVPLSAEPTPPSHREAPLPRQPAGDVRRPAAVG